MPLSPTPSPTVPPAEPNEAAGAQAGPRAAKLPRHLWRSAAERLVASSAPAHARSLAAERFLEAAPTVGIDMSLVWGVVGPVPVGRGKSGTGVREVCLAVLAPGRTAMIFMGGTADTPPRAAFGRGTAAARRATEAHAERVACVNAACEALAAMGGGEQIAIAQALLEQREKAGTAALEEAGFIRVAELAYLQAPASAASRRVESPAWPGGVTVERFSQTPERTRDDDLLEALARSYVDTLDCPDLCGLRDPADVLASHKAVGTFDPDLWWLVRDEGRPAGCALFSVNAEARCAELVYLGLGPSLRGRGIASSLLAMGMHESVARSREITTGGVRWVQCAVDLRNTPALSLYRRAGFERTQVRTAMVRPLRAAPDEERV